MAWQALVLAAILMVAPRSSLAQSVATRTEADTYAVASVASVTSTTSCGTAQWTDTAGVLPATVTLSNANPVSQCLTVTNLNMSVPVGATVTAISVTLTRSATNAAQVGDGAVGLLNAALTSSNDITTGLVSPYGFTPLTTTFTAGVLDQAVKVGSAFQVNQRVLSDQARPRIAVLPNGQFAATYTSYEGAVSLNDIYLKMFYSNSTSAGDETQVNVYTSDTQMNPEIATFDSGNKFVIVWQSIGQDGDFFGVFGQLYTSSGVKIGAEFQINTVTAGDQSAQHVAGLENGGFVVVWHGQLDSDLSGIYGQIFDSAGVRVGGVFRLNTYQNSSQGNPHVAGLKSGNFFATWHSDTKDGSGHAVAGQLFNSTGSFIGTEISINSYTSGNQMFPSVAGLSDGKFVVVWAEQAGQDGFGGGVFGQRFDAAANKLGPEFQVNTVTSGHQEWPAVAPLPLGRFVVMWESGSSEHIAGGYGQLFDDTGAKVGSEFLISTPVQGWKFGPVVASLSNENFVALWTGQDSSGNGVFGQLYATPATVVTSPNFGFYYCVIRTGAGPTATVSAFSLDVIYTVPTMMGVATIGTSAVVTTGASTTGTPAGVITDVATTGIAAEGTTSAAATGTPTVSTTGLIVSTNSAGATASSGATAGTSAFVTVAVTPGTPVVLTAGLLVSTDSVGGESSLAVLLAVIGVLVLITAAVAVSLIILRRRARQSLLRSSSGASSTSDSGGSEQHESVTSTKNQYQHSKEASTKEKGRHSKDDGSVASMSVKVKGQQTKKDYGTIVSTENRYAGNPSDGSVALKTAKGQRSKDSVASTNDKDQHSIRDVVVLEEIGAGYFGRVFRGTWQSESVAIKTVASGNIAELQAELSILQRLNHPLIVRYYGLLQLEQALGGESAIVLEYCSGGSLEKALRIGSVAHEHLSRLAVQIARGLEYLAGQGILHRDLATRNIVRLLVVVCVFRTALCSVMQIANKLIWPYCPLSCRAGFFLREQLLDATGKCRLTDFGLARAVDAGETYVVTSALPIRWSAPEVLAERGFTSQSDVYSLAITLWELFSEAATPFTEISTNAGVTAAVVSGIRPAKPPGIPADIFHVIERCWSPNPSDRPSARGAAEELAAFIEGPLFDSGMSSDIASDEGKSGSHSAEDYGYADKFE